jgi:hypothetical protein
MGPLRNLTFPTVTVETAGGSFAVRGLNPDMVVGLYNRHRGELSTLFDFFVARATEDAAAEMDVASLIEQMLAQSPLVMAELIALASGSKPTDTHVEQDLETNADLLTDWERDVAMSRALPRPVQLDALQKIAEQTFTSDMPAGKFLAVVIKAAGATTATVSPLLSH